MKYIILFLFSLYLIRKLMIFSGSNDFLMIVGVLAQISVIATFLWILHDVEKKL